MRALLLCDHINKCTEVSRRDSAKKNLSMCTQSGVTSVRAFSSLGNNHFIEALFTLYIKRTALLYNQCMISLTPYGNHIKSGRSKKNECLSF